jgi:hypothetical protein
MKGVANEAALAEVCLGIKLVCCSNGRCRAINGGSRCWGGCTHLSQRWLIAATQSRAHRNIRAKLRPMSIAPAKVTNAMVSADHSRAVLAATAVTAADIFSRRGPTRDVKGEMRFIAGHLRL